jgi:hypothetical protein
MAAGERPRRRGTRTATSVAALVIAAVLAIGSGAADAATVTVTGHVTVGGVGVEGFGVRSLAGGPTVQTDSSGEFSLPLSTGFQRISVGQSGLPNFSSTTRVRFDVTVTAGTVLDVDLPAPGTATVRVLDTNGDPVEGATVSGRRSSTTGSLTVPGSAPTFESTVEATTDAAGEAVVADHPGPVDLEIEHEAVPRDPTRHALVAGADIFGGGVIEATLDALVEVTGQVTRGGQPVDDATVTVRQDPLDSAGTAASGPDGSFTLGALPGPSKVSVEGPGFHPALLLRSDVEVADGLVVDAELPPVVKMTVNVVDTRGDPPPVTAAGLEMSEVSAPWSLSGPDATIAVSDSDVASGGSVVLGAVPGTADFQGQAWGPLSAPVRTATADDVTVVDGGTVPLTVTAVPAAPGDVTMRAAGPGHARLTWAAPDAGDSPITRYDVMVGDPGPYEGQLRPEARFPLPDPPPIYTVAAGARATTIPALPNGSSTELRLRAVSQLGPGPWVLGHVTPRFQHRVDVVGRAYGDTIGGNDYSHGVLAQLISVDLRNRHAARYQFEVQNDGSTRERLVLTDRSNAAGLTVRWFVGTRNITPAVRAGTYRTRLLGAGASLPVTALVTTRRAEPRDLYRVTLEGRPVGLPGQHDAVNFWVTIRPTR